MVPCGSSPVTRFALASAKRKTKRLRRKLTSPCKNIQQPLFLPQFIPAFFMESFHKFLGLREQCGSEAMALSAAYPLTIHYKIFDHSSQPDKLRGRQAVKIPSLQQNVANTVTAALYKKNSPRSMVVLFKRVMQYAHLRAFLRLRRSVELPTNRHATQATKRKVSNSRQKSPCSVWHHVMWINQ